MNPGTLAAIRALDDDRLAQLLVLVDDFGWPVAKAWLSRWRNGGIDATNRNGGAASTVTAVCKLGIRSGSYPDENHPQAVSRRKYPRPSRGSYV